MARSLRKFRGIDIKLSRSESYEILRFFFPQSRLRPSAVREPDCAFAQALLVEALDRSSRMGLFEALFREVLGCGVAREYPRYQTLVVRFLSEALSHWFCHLRWRPERPTPKIYESVRATLALNYRPIWDRRERGEGLTY